MDDLFLHAFNPLQALVVCACLPSGRGGDSRSAQSADPPEATRMRLVVVLLAVLGFAHASAASPTKYLVKVRSDKRIDFSTIRTYTWMAGWPAFDPSIDWQIEADVDRGLAALGLTKLTAEPCDTVVTYAAIRRTDVDVKTRVSPDSDLRREYPAGTVIVVLLDPRNRRELFRGRADMRLQAMRLDGARRFETPSR